MTNLRDTEIYTLAELSRRLANIARWGSVHELDAAAARVRVHWADDEAGDPVLTAWLPWLTTRAGADQSWWAPTVGEQVLLVSPSGDLAQAVVLPAVYQDTHPAPAADPNKQVVRYSDGAVIAYDRSAHHLEAVLPGEATAKVVATGGVRIEGDTTIVGNLVVEGEGTVKSDLTVEGNADVEGNVNGDGNVSDQNGSMQEMRTFYNSHAHTPTGVQLRMT